MTIHITTKQMQVMSSGMWKCWNCIISTRIFKSGKFLNLRCKQWCHDEFAYRTNNKLYCSTNCNTIQIWSWCTQYLLNNKQLSCSILISTAAQLAQLVGCQTAKREVAGSNPSQATNRGLKITGKIMLAVFNTLSQFRLSRQWEVR